MIAANRWIIAENRSDTREELIDATNGKRIFLTNKGPLRDAAGHVLGILGIARDFTELKQAEAALRESETRFQDIVNASADCIWEVDAEARLTYLSESVQTLVGYTAQEALGKTTFDFMLPKEAARVQTLFAEIAARRKPFRDLGTRIYSKDGTPLTCRSTARRSWTSWVIVG